MKATMRYIVFQTDTPSNLADFYRRHLGLEELGRSNQGDVSATDGFFNITFLKRRPELHESRSAPGLHHFGFQVDNLEETLERYRALMPNMPTIKEKGGLHFGDVRVFDPEGMPISLSEKPFGVDKIQDRLPRIRHVACNALWPEGILNFYTLLFGFRELEASRERRKQGRLNRFCGDGFTNIAIHPFYNESEGHEPWYGVNHIGFLVADVLKAVDQLSGEIPVSKRPDSRPYAEYRLNDPEGNKFDLGQTKGWEVDVDKWERAA
jgi:catechol 2,3-dioxygenase-like lactoylglutathione lyase family enzyme